ncbi:uncharacterized protein PAC_03007 [Phialocephala subalpina]|uniref:Ferric oxidoreductase domain-containing protein n=1 Tax=Phialocephala subalpina TaxID=576137 RepID=A0A1L7WK27_9HELO|nr:uncharacterized protein PAC_03007 [Phialocephala subalpina]
MTWTKTTIEYDEVENMLDDVHKEIAPDPKPHHLHHEDREDAARHQFLRSVMGTDKNRIARQDFANIVRGWKAPSMDPDKKAEEDHDANSGHIHCSCHWLANWSGHVAAGQVSDRNAVSTFWPSSQTPFQAIGWGCSPGEDICRNSVSHDVLSRSVDVKIPSTFFMNWDLSQSFHIKLSLVALLFATTHAIGHLTGSFLYGSRPAQQPAVAAVLGPDTVSRPYRDYVASLPGWSGITAFGLFWILAGMSVPYMRKKSYELFQLGHLLMFPIIGLLCVHGTAALLQIPIISDIIGLNVGECVDILRSEFQDPRIQYS